MIQVSEAKELIIENRIPPRIKEHQLLDALGCVLARDVFAAMDTPPFSQSAMDGYTFSYEGWDKKSNLRVVGEIQTGSYSSERLKANQAFRIFTGAPIPPGADTVVMQEKVRVDNNAIEIQDETISEADNTRPQGSQTKEGEIALKKGQLLTPAGISYLAGIGISKVSVFAKPRVSIISTGKELVQAGNELSEGKIFESNSIGLVAALHQLNIQPVSVELVDDVEEEIEQAISNQLQADILILTGGVSVGNYDLVPASLEKCGVHKVFHKIKQKPGKPIYFGKHRHTLVFALPGNPAAVMSCFYEYVVLAISNFTQKNYFKTLQLPLAGDFSKKLGLTYFLKGKTGENEVSILDSQLSYLLNSFAVADCLVVLDQEKEHFKKGDLVPVSMIV